MLNVFVGSQLFVRLFVCWDGNLLVFVAQRNHQTSGSLRKLMPIPNLYAPNMFLGNGHRLRAISWGWYPWQIWPWSLWWKFQVLPGYACPPGLELGSQSSTEFRCGSRSNAQRRKAFEQMKQLGSFQKVSSSFGYQVFWTVDTEI